MSNRRNNRERQPSPQRLPQVTLTLPGLWESRPAAWFVTVESTFDAIGLTNQQKYAAVLPALPPDIFDALWPIFQDPPPTGRYEHLKAEILKCFTPS